MLEGRRIVLVEDDKIMGASMVQRLEIEGADVQWHRQVARALPAIRTPRKAVDAVICDIRLPDGTGEELYETLTRTSHPPPFLFITGQGTIDQAVRLMRSGALDYIAKPFDMGSFLARLARIMPARNDHVPPIETGITEAARVVDQLAAEAARKDTPVLICAARGLGKIRLARRIHDTSDRRAAPFIVLDAYRGLITIDAMRDALVETGEGSLLIVGLGLLTADAQILLMENLRGALFRLFVTTGPDAEGTNVSPIREDLMALLRSHEIVIPSLSERPEDAVWMASQLFPELNARKAVPLVGISATAEEAIRAHDWPGNGRELRARLIRAMEMAKGDLVLTTDIFPEREGNATLQSLAEVRDAAERAQIFVALERTQGQVGEAARLLRVSRTTLWEKMQKLGL